MHSFDIIDKHRGLIASSLHFKRLLISGIDVGLDSHAGSDEGMLSYTTLKTPVAIKDDVVLTTIHSETRTLHADPGYLARVDVQFT